MNAIKRCNIDDCNIYDVQKILKHKWVPIIIYCMEAENITFSYLSKRIDHISNKSLSQSLNFLTSQNIIYKDKHYVLTNSGKELLKIILLMSSFNKD